MNESVLTWVSLRVRTVKATGRGPGRASLRDHAWLAGRRGFFLRAGMKGALAASPFDPPIASVFYVLAAIAQLLLATFILVRHRRREWAWIFSGLFVANAGAALSAALRTGFFPGQEDWGTRAGQYFDHASFVLIAYLALAFPARPRFLQKVPWALPTLAVALLAFLFFVNGLHLEGLSKPRAPDTELTPLRIVSGFLFPAAVWTLLVARWTAKWLTPMPEFLRRQFQFVFAAFALRAGNQLVATLPVPPKSEAFPGALQLAQGLNFAPLAAFMVAVGLLALAQNRQAGSPRGRTYFVLCFMVAGLAVGTLSLTLTPLTGYFVNTFGHFDLYILRPAMVWIAISRFSLLGLEERQDRWGLGILWILSMAALAVVAAPIGGRLPGPAMAWTVLFASAFATILILAARPWVLASASRVDQGLESSLETYRAALGEAYRNGEPNGREQANLARRREWLGISMEQHQAMVQGLSKGRGSPPRFMPGDVIGGRYRIEKLLGEGAVGEAYAADDVLGGQQVVLKRTRKADATHRRTVLREAETMARIHHPNVVQLLRVEFLGDEPVLVLERMQGSLQTRLAAGDRMATEEAVRITLDVLDAVQALHAAGIVHRDLKPGNILLAENGRAKVADFGIAHAPNSLLGDPTAMTIPAGSLRYMAPEVLRGVHSDGRADVYAVAMILYEMLSGAHPLPQGLSDYEARKAIVDGEWPPLPAQIPGALRASISRGLQKDPAKRHPSAAGFAQALRATSGRQARSAPR